jgi:type I restriction enzyme M protein
MTLAIPEDRIGVEVPVQMGSTVADKPADIVIFYDNRRDRHWITIEVKKPTRKDGIEQLKSYMNPTGSTFGYWTNGADEKFLLRSDPNDFSKPIWRLPRAGETLDDLDEPITRLNLEPVKDLHGIFKEIEQEILAHQTVDTFDEIFKVVFSKLFDERVNLYNDKAVAQFRIGVAEDSLTAADRVRALFAKAKAKWSDVYPPRAEIELSDANIAFCVKALQQYHLIRSGDVLGVAFELLVNQEMKGEMGQYFTPRQVVKMMTKMMNPRLDERVCDPACGSGGFLIYAMRQVFDFIEARWDNPDDRAEQRKDYAQANLIGTDNDRRLVQVAKAYMIMENDGRSGVFCVDALDYNAYPDGARTALTGRPVSSAQASPVALCDPRQPTDGVDLVLTNPPFAGGIRANSTLRQYDIATVQQKPTKKEEREGRPGKIGVKDEVVRAILFIERCLDLLKPGGRMGIVLPQGLFNNVTDQYVRDFVDERARILAVVGLHPYTFKPFTLAKTSVLFLQKKLEGEELPPDYPIFMALSVRPGKTNLGRPLYLDDGVTLDSDMDEVADAFLAWAQTEGFEFADDEI